MEYYKNFMADAVVRVDNERRYVKRVDNLTETLFSNPNSVTAFGGETYGVFYELLPISKEDYDSFGKTWTFDEYGEKSSL